jgi:hypothetical protein
MWIVLRAVSTLPPSTVQLPSASTSPSTHFVCLYTFYSYNFAAIFVQAMSLFYVYTHLRLYSTPTLICGCTAVSTVPDVWRCLYSTPTLTCGRTAVSIVPDVCRRLYSTPTFIWFYASAAHHLPCFQGGKECMATLHSSDRDFTLHYILHLHLENIFAIQASTNILHSTSTSTFRFLHNHPTFSEHFRDPGVYIRSTFYIYILRTIILLFHIPPVFKFFFDSILSFILQFVDIFSEHFRRDFSKFLDFFIRFSRTLRQYCVYIYI